MNVYDFDKTIYNGDSTAHFYFYCLHHQPKIAVWLPYQGISFLMYALRLYTKTQFKERFYKFFKSVDNIEAEVESFWDEKLGNIKKWYLKNQKADDVIISASPEFLLRPACKRLGIKSLIASRVDMYNGKYTGLNCWGGEKVKRLREEMGDVKYEFFYTDSYSDSPLAELAEKESFIVKGEELLPWKKK